MAFHMTIDALRDFKVLFDGMDKSGDGYITAKELIDANVLPEKDANNMISDGDFDGDRKLDFSEYLRLVCTGSEALPEELLKACKSVDKDGNGFISAEELRPALKSIGVVLVDDSNLEKKIKEADTNNDGKLDYNELINLLVKQ